MIYVITCPFLTRFCLFLGSGVCGGGHLGSGGSQYMACRVQNEEGGKKEQEVVRA